ncbi:hypothetical protein QBC46DRAFT_372316 [Diplogelasinospora grovesii]|uniref:Mucin-7 n=1 Tax=Diplogelasinospora grovesii TaxID=303347 RepID=A0AAN6S9J5_9PEZI|nr:hypothetical protein QBC46DRAFT_372316 [Diplogelasinospora grovesii]
MTMSQVRNLRAMFEQKGETSPEDRGRSPTGTAPITPNESPRPLSKVRTDFIAVEKDGRIGLQRTNSQNSSFSAQRKLSGESDVSIPLVQLERPNSFTDTLAKTPAKSSLKEQPIPESPRTETGPPIFNIPLRPTQKSKMATAIAEGPKGLGIDGADDKATVPGNSSVTAGNPQHVNGNASGKDEGTPACKETAKNGTKTATKTLAPSTAAGKPAAKSATVAKAPKSPATTSTPKLPTKTPEKKVVQPEKTATPKATSHAPKPAGSSSIKKPPSLQPSPSSSTTGFVKPKPKSPTRPVKLPDRLTTHTAASVSKVNIPRQSLSRASGVIHTVDSFGRSPSRISVAATAGTTKSLKRQSSTINRPRPSLGPPPKLPAKDHPPTKKEKEVDESFLARMMRPTAASSSKTNEKVPTTPPRKPTVAPVAKKVAHRPETKVVKKVLTPKIAAETVAPASKEPETSATKEVAVEVEQVATAEEAVGIAKAAEGEASLPADAEQESAAQAVAPMVEQSATAEEAIQAAKEIDGEHSVPEDSQTGAGEHDEKAAEKAEEAEPEVESAEPETKEPEAHDSKDAAPIVNGDHEKTEADVQEETKEEEVTETEASAQ